MFKKLLKKITHKERSYIVFYVFVIGGRQAHGFLNGLDIDRKRFSHLNLNEINNFVEAQVKKKAKMPKETQIIITGIVDRKKI